MNKPDFISRRGFAARAAGIAAALLVASTQTFASGGTGSGNSANAPIGAEGARHLLGRAGFAAMPADIQAYAKLNRSDAADKLLKPFTGKAVTAPPPWVDELPLGPAKRQSMSREQLQDEQRLNNERADELREWWLREMLNTPSPLTEKMTLFWHNHFATSQRKVRFTVYMYRQNIMLRNHALGNFGTMLHEVARDPAMLIYLDSVNNRKEQPNENFAREVMELFTLGEGHYSEQDIKQVARAFTGWSLDRESGQFMFRRAIHDYGDKTIFGKSGNFEGDQVIDMLLARPETAQFITRKLWREFVSPTPDEAEVKRMAAVFKDSGYNVAKLMRTMLTSDVFYASENRAVLIKSPTEFVVGTLKTFEIDAPNLRPFMFVSANLGQLLFAPPNVKGWPGGENWINTASLLQRKQMVDRLFRNEDRMEVAMRAMDEMAERNGDMGPPGKAGRMARLADRQMGGIRWNLDAWANAFMTQHGAEGEKTMTRMVLAMAPQRSLEKSANDKGADLARQLVLDPAYQLK
jgi:uncharacterized protein (DUF1800 family)